MALTPSFVVRRDDTSGKNIKTGRDGAGNIIQFVSLTDDVGEQTGISGAALPVVLDSSGPVSFYDSGAAADTQEVVSTSGVRVKEVFVSLAPGVSGDRWVMLFNANSARTNGALPVTRFKVPAADDASRTFEAERTFPTGLVVAVSTTIGTLTLPGSGEAYFSVQYTAA